MGRDLLNSILSTHYSFQSLTAGEFTLWVASTLYLSLCLWSKQRPFVLETRDANQKWRKASNAMADRLCEAEG